jgi:hypothetical protein
MRATNRSSGWLADGPGFKAFGVRRPVEPEPERVPEATSQASREEVRSLIGPRLPTDGPRWLHFSCGMALLLRRLAAGGIVLGVLGALRRGTARRVACRIFGCPGRSAVGHVVLGRYPWFGSTDAPGRACASGCAGSYRLRAVIGECLRGAEIDLGQLHEHDGFALVQVPHHSPRDVIGHVRAGQESAGTVIIGRLRVLVPRPSA